jgi:hypothetical protein
VTTVVLSPTNVATFPEGGGHFWVYMQYVHGLRALGCDVYWLEQVESSGDTTRDARLQATFFERMRRFGMQGKAILYERDASAPQGITSHGCEAGPLAERADLLLNFHYGIAPDVLSRFRRTAAVDIDPGLLQHWISTGQIDLPAHDLYFTTGETVGTPEATFDDCGLPWIRIRPAVALDLWEYSAAAKQAPFTTVSSWMGGVDGEWVTDPSGGFYDNNKRASFLKYLELPKRTSQSLELALCLDESRASEAAARKNAYAGYQGDAADRRRLEAHGWRVRHANEVASSPQDYRAYVRGSRGEFSCAKPSCMRFRNAWISDRTLCYLASGRPAVVQDTGPSSYLPNGAGLFRFSTLDEAAAALETVAADYRAHSRSARDLATDYFDARKTAADILGHALG